MARITPETLIEGVLAADEDAWSRLWPILKPKLLATLRRPSFIGRLSESEDDCRNIVAQVMSRLRAEDHARLRAFQELRQQSPGLPFMPWLLVVAKRVAIDYMCQHDEYLDRRREKDASHPGAWRVLETLVDGDSPGVRPPITDEATAHEILESAANLPSLQQRALRGWLAGRGFAELAVEEGKDAREVERALRAGLQKLRRRFRQ